MFKRRFILKVLDCSAVRRWQCVRMHRRRSCNFDSTATYDDESCLYADALGECGGTCNADVDADGICDDVDPCVGAIDACGMCNGPGEPSTVVDAPTFLKATATATETFIDECGI